MSLTIEQRPRALPFRTSPTSKHSPTSFSQNHSFAFRPQTLTPVDSSDDGSDDETPAVFSRRSQEPQTSSSSIDPFGVTSSFGDDAMDLTESQPPSSPTLPWQSKQTSSLTLPPSIDAVNSTEIHSFARPKIPSQNSSFLSAPTRTEVNPDGGRIPTPVYGHFSQAGAGTGMLRLPSHAAPRELGPISPIPASPMSPGDSATEAAWWQRRRLPSPVEDGNDEDTAMSPVGMIDTMLPKLNVSRPGVPEESILGADHSANIDVDSIRRSPSPFGRARSNATSVVTNNSTTSSTRLSMGYRADCEKCVRKVPGHYTHILR